MKNESDYTLSNHVDSLIELLTNINAQLKNDRDTLTSPHIINKSTSNIETTKLLNQILHRINLIKEKIPSNEPNFIAALTAYVESINTTYSASLKEKLNQISMLISQGYENLTVNHQIVNENLRELNTIWSNLHKLANNNHVYDKPK